jgi:hypothetical protein
LDQGISRQPKLCAPDWRDVGEPPVFIACGGEAYFRKTRECVFPQLSQPRKISSRSTPLNVGEVLEVNPQILG